MKNKALFKVGRDTGVNPVARAVAKQKLLGTVTDMRINIFQLDHGTACESDAATMDIIITAVLVALKEEPESVDFRMMLAAKHVIEQCFARGCIWHKEDTVTIDNALEITLKRWPKFSPYQANIAIKSAMGARHG